MTLLAPGDRAHDFTLPDGLSGEPRSLADWRGRPVVLLFYRGPWCGVCRAHLHKVRKRYAEIRDAGGEVIAIYPGKVENLRNYFTQQKLPFPVLVDQTGGVIDQYGIRNRWALIHRGIPHPSTYVLDDCGIVRFADVRYQHFFRLPVTTLVAEVRNAAQARIVKNATNTPQDL